MCIMLNCNCLNILVEFRVDLLAIAFLELRILRLASYNHFWNIANLSTDLMLFFVCMCSQDELVLMEFLEKMAEMEHQVVLTIQNY